VDSTKEISRRSAIAVVLICLGLAACGSDRRTVVVNAPPDSTTVVDRDGRTHVVVPND
jgi:hypothetical protein